MTNQSIINSIGMEFVYIPPNSFFMGSSPNEPGAFADERRYQVSLSKGFYLQTTTVTLGQWRKFSQETKYQTEAEREDWTWCYLQNGKIRIPWLLPAHDWKKEPGYCWDNPGFFQAEDYPVTCISWNDAQYFIEWLNEKEHRIYQLPTEAEWEYACRAGTTTAYSCGETLSTRQARFHWTSSHSIVNFFVKFKRKIIGRKKGTAPVKSFPPNAWGLDEMHGNVWEWCRDAYQKDLAGEKNTVTDPFGAEGDHKTLRGGSWFYSAEFCRSAKRRSLKPNERASGIGFRLSLA